MQTFTEQVSGLVKKALADPADPDGALFILQSLVDVCTGNEWIDNQDIIPELFREDASIEFKVNSAHQTFQFLVEQRADLLVKAGRLDEALDAWKLSLRVAEGYGFFRFNPPYALYIHSKVVGVQAALGLREDALLWLRAAVEKSERLLGAGHRTTLHLMEAEARLRGGGMPEFAERGGDDSPFANQFPGDDEEDD